MARSRQHALVGAGQRDHAAADAGGAGGAGASGVARPVAHASGARGRAGRRGGPAVGHPRVSAARAAAARDGHHPGRPARRRRPGRRRRTARAAGRRALHGRGRGQLRLRPAARRARHQCPPRAGPARRLPSAAGGGPVRSGTAAGRIAATGRARRRGALVRRGDGTGRTGLLRRQPALRRLPGGPRLRVAGRGSPRRARGGRALSGAGPALRRHEPAVPGTAARGAPRFRHPGQPGRFRRGVGRPGATGPRAGRAGCRRPRRSAAGRPLRAAGLVPAA